MAQIIMEIDDQLLWETVFGSSPFSFGRGEWFPDAEYLGDADWDKPGRIMITGVDDDDTKVTKIITVVDLAKALPIANKLVSMDLFDFDNYDCICGDAVLQVAVFGKVIYG
jgi:hypothetical protein